MLPEVVLPSEDALLGWFLETGTVVVCCFEMVFVCVGLLTEDAHRCAVVVDDESAFWRTAPLVDRKVKSLLVALPVVFRCERVRAERTLVGPTSPLQTVCMTDVFPTVATR